MQEGFIVQNCVSKLVTKISAMDIGLESPVTVKHQDDVYANIIKFSYGKGFLIGTNTMVQDMGNT